MTDHDHDRKLQDAEKCGAKVRAEALERREWKRLPQDIRDGLLSDDPEVRHEAEVRSIARRCGLPDDHPDIERLRREGPPRVGTVHGRGIDYND